MSPFHANIPLHASVIILYRDHHSKPIPHSIPLSPFHTSVPMPYPCSMCPQTGRLSPGHLLPSYGSWSAESAGRSAPLPATAHTHAVIYHYSINNTYIHIHTITVSTTHTYVPLQYQQHTHTYMYLPLQYQWKALKCKPSAQFDWNAVTFGLKTSLHVLGEHNGTKTELYRTNTKSQGLVPSMIISIVVHVVKHQSVLICRRQGSLRMMLGSPSIIIAS